jgi:hypothetical protein
MLDVAIVAIFFGLAIGYANLCHRLLSASDEADKDAS